MNRLASIDLIAIITKSTSPEMPAIIPCINFDLFKHTDLSIFELFQ